MSGIFVSYRREHSGVLAERLLSELKEQFPGEYLFRDLDKIDAVVDIVGATEAALSARPVMLPLIGPHWIGARDANGLLLLEDPTDRVHFEIATALRQRIPVIAVLVGDTPMPSEAELPKALKPLARCSVQTLSTKRWGSDIDQLFVALERRYGLARTRPISVPPPPPQRRAELSLAAKVGLGAILASGAIALTAGLGTDRAPSTERIPPAKDETTAVLPSAPLETHDPVTAETRGLNVTAPTAPSVATLQTARVDPDGEETGATPTALEPSTPAGPPPNVSGAWRSDSGEVYVLEQDGSAVRLLTQDATGLVIGDGVLRGSLLELSVVDMTSGERAKLDVVVLDANTMAGTALLGAASLKQQIRLTRLN